MTDRTTSERDSPVLEALPEEPAPWRPKAPGPPSLGLGVLIKALVVLGLVGIVGAVTVRWNRGEPAPVASPTEQPTPQETLVSPTPPPPGGFAGHGEAYETVAQLARASDLIVVGTVERSRVASEIGEGPDDPFPTRILHTLVAVEEVFKGSEAEETVIVATDELGFQGPGVEDWRERGHRALLFLMYSRENPSRYVPTGFAYSQAAYFVEDQQVEMTIGGDVNGLSERIAAMTLSELREKLRASRM